MNIRVGTLKNRAAESPEAAKTEANPRLGWLLAVCCVAQFMVILDLSIVNVALPSMQSDLNISPINLPWVVDAYAIVFAGFLMLAGRASDRYGPRRTLVAALILFSLASLAGGAATNQDMLIAARALQGFSGAMMAASSLAAITMSFPAGPQRFRAIALWGAMNGAGGAAGGLFGGVLTQELSWRWVLLINPPIGIATAGVAFAVVAAGNRRVGAAKSFDIAGAVTLTLGQIVLVYGIVNGGQYGWTSGWTLIPIVIGLVILMAFNYIELKVAKDPLIPFHAITKALGRANLIVITFSAALFPMWFVSSLYLQEVLGLSPLKAGLAFFPMALAIMLTAQRAGKLVGLFGVRTVLTCGLLLMTAGLLLFTRIGPSGSSLGFIVLPGVLVAVGIGLSIVPSTIAATHAVKPEQAGLASGLVNTSRQAGGGIGIALLISLATTYTTHLIGTNHPVPDSLTSGFRLAYIIAAGLCLLAAGFSFFLLAKHEQAPAKEGEPAPVPPKLWKRLPVVAAAIVVVFATVDFTFAGAPGSPIGFFKLQGSYSYVSAPGLHPPIIKQGLKTTGTPTPGYILTANFYDLARPPMTGQSGPLILSNNLQPVWFQPVPEAVVASNLAQQTYHGQPVLTYWQGLITNAGQTTSGEYVVLNQHYQKIATLKGANGWVLTLHTMLIDGDDAWVTANKNRAMNLSNWGGVAEGALDDSAIQEYNLTTGKLVRSWDALRHIPLSDSHALPPDNSFPWDAYHVNSLDLVGKDTLLVSMRDTWTLYLINMKTNKVEWQLGGRHSDYTFGNNATFSWQHDATLLPGGKISMFDDHCCQQTGGGTYVDPTAPSRAIVLKVNQATHHVTLVSQYKHAAEAGVGVDASYMGAAQVMPDGHIFSGWGNLPYITEYSKSGQLVLDGYFPGSDLSYRASKIPPTAWIGLPLTKPSAAVKTSGGKTTVYMSWNGATQVVKWRVLAGTSASSLTPVATRAKNLFETAVLVPGSNTFFQVQALDASGKVIGTSKVVKS
jgi:EmrB/QacA subfamily drug resistance transporter